MLNGKVAVVFGGASNECEISVITGTMAANVLKEGGADVLPVYISQGGEFFCGEGLADIAVFKAGREETFPRCIVADGGVYVRGKRGRVKSFVRLYAALNCCHGGIGEGGGLAGLFACAGIPMAGGIFEGSAFIDKHLTKLVLKGLGVKTLPYAVCLSAKDVAAAAEITGLPAIIKPACLGSSIGVQRADDMGQYVEAVESALCYGDSALCEPYITDRREINCAVCLYGGRAHVSECEESLSGGGIFTFDDKYSGGNMSQIPADIPQETAQFIRAEAERIFCTLGMSGVVRFDFLLSRGEVFLSEVNTVPGSLGWYLFSRSFKEFYPVLEGMLLQAVEDNKNRRLKRLLKTGILGSVSLNCGKIK